ncbi:DoxX family protein [Nocardioides bruguierae]|uniref:DoxX family protein n=1 Tax=Nocardioides bruguierae TaxID=2945102 RepID=A0A9X2IHP1_9ACTN|nr:DoxX family protein [Nocardioides bruguierae]MCM0622794.1 DoxX family protein [Nocardioides bruguierae]
MQLTAQIVAIIVALAMLASGSVKILRTDRIVGLMSNVGVHGKTLTVLGCLQVAASVGLLAGLAYPPFGIAAAAGLILYFAGAVGAHVRARDPEWQAAAALLVVSSFTFGILLVAA